jgi:hypothetical protein
MLRYLEHIVYHDKILLILGFVLRGLLYNRIIKPRRNLRLIPTGNAYAADHLLP